MSKPKVTQADRDAVREIRWVRDVEDADQIMAHHRQSAQAETLALLEQAREVLEEAERIAEHKGYWPQLRRFQDCRAAVAAKIEEIRNGQS